MGEVVRFDKDTLDSVAGLIFTEIGGRRLVEEFKQLKKEFDWNPFDDDGDAYEGPWNEIRHNFALISDVAYAAVGVAERITIEGRMLDDPQKHAAVVKVLDDIIRLPWYAEPFDGKVLGMLVSVAVKGFKALGALTDEGDKEVDAIDVKLDELPDGKKVRTARKKANRRRITALGK